MVIKEFIEMLMNIQDIGYEEAKELGIELISKNEGLNKELLKGVMVYD